MLRALVFDLDDTLYAEEDFVKSGYEAVARYLAEAGRCPFEEAFALMVGTLGIEGRHMVFQRLMEGFPEASISIPEAVKVYRQHFPSIRLCPGYGELLKELGQEYKLGIITDGLPAVQERKVRALGLSSLINRIIYTWEYGQEKQKPHPLPFSKMLQDLGVEPGCALFIGDNPDKDCKGAHAAGIKAAQVHRNKFVAVGQELPEFFIETLFELPQILRQMN